MAISGPGLSIKSLIDAFKFKREEDRMKQVVPLLEQARESYELLKKKYPEAITPEVEELFNRVYTKAQARQDAFFQRKAELEAPKPEFLSNAISNLLNSGTAKSFTQLGSEFLSGVGGAGERISGALGALMEKGEEMSPAGPLMQAMRKKLGMQGNVFQQLAQAFREGKEFYSEHGIQPEQYSGLGKISAEFLKNAVSGAGQAAVDIPAIMVTPGGLIGYSGTMATGEALQRGEKGLQLLKSMAKGTAHGALLHGVLKSMGYLPRGLRISGGAVVFGGPALQEELSKPEDERDWSRVAAEFFIGGGLMAGGGKGMKLKEIWEDFKRYKPRRASIFEKKVKDFVKNAEKSAEKGSETADLAAKEAEIVNFVKKEIENLKEGEGNAETISGAKEKVPERRIQRGEGKGEGGEDLQFAASGQAGAPRNARKEKAGKEGKAGEIEGREKISKWQAAKREAEKAIEEAGDYWLPGENSVNIDEIRKRVSKIAQKYGVPEKILQKQVLWNYDKSTKRSELADVSDDALLFAINARREVINKLKNKFNKLSRNYISKSDYREYHRNKAILEKEIKEAKRRGLNIEESGAKEKGIEDKAKFANKNPWELTLEEYSKVNDKPEAGIEHEAAVIDALRSGEKVPERVLKDYPAIAEKYRERNLEERWKKEYAKAVEIRQKIEDLENKKERLREAREQAEKKGTGKEPWEMTREEYEVKSQATWGDYYLTPDGKFVTIKSGGGLGSNRVKAYDPVTGKFVGHYNRDELEFVKPKKYETAATKAADEWLEEVSSKVKKIREENEKLLFKADLTDRFRKELEKGTIAQEQYDEKVKNGTLLNEEQYAKANEIRKKIEEIKNKNIEIPENIEHKKIVEKALKEGKDVPDEVLKEYPDLEKRYKEKEQAEGKEQYRIKVTLDKELLKNAYRWTSQDPERRAKETLKRFEDYLNDIYGELRERLKDDSNIEKLNEEFDNYAAKYADKRNELLAMHGKLASPMVTGAAKFPAEKMRKLNAAYDKKLKAFKEWNKRAVNRLFKRVDQLNKMETLPPNEELFEFSGGRVINNYEAERVQIFFDDIPSAELRAKLKKAGWRWSPKNKAWQRKNTENAILSAERILKGKAGGTSRKEFAEEGGYAVGNYEGEYAKANPRLVEMPELVEFLQQINEGKFPKIHEYFWKKLGRLGYAIVGGKSADVHLRSDIFIGHERWSQTFKRRPALSDEFREKIANKVGIPLDRLRIKIFHRNDRWIVKAYEYDPTLAAKVLAHEIGHVVDSLPEKEFRKGNILGRIASLHKYYKEFLPAYPGAPGELTAKDRARLRREAKRLVEKDGERWVEKEILIEVGQVTPEEILDIWRGYEAREKDPELYKYIAGLSSAEKKSIVKEALKGNVPDWFKLRKKFKKIVQKVKEKIPLNEMEKEIQKKYFELIQEEVKKRRLFQLSVIMDELKKLTKIWKPFNEFASKKTTKYRFSPEELYADAFSVLVNDPGLLENAAPNFYKAFFNWLGQKPEVKRVWDVIQARLRGDRSEVLKRRKERIREMFEHEEEIKKGAFAEEISLGEAAKSFYRDLKRALIDQNEYAKVKVREVMKEKLKKGEIDEFMKIRDDNPIYSIDELSHTTGKVFQMLRDVKNEIINAGEKLGLTKEDIGELMFERRVMGERMEMANPLGFSPKEALEQMGYFEKEIGKEKFQKLEKLVEEFHDIYQHHVVDLLEKADVFNSELIKLMRDNKYYATFDVLQYFEKRYGKGITAKIYRQIGTLKEIGNPFMATVVKGASLMRMAEKAIITRDFIDFMDKHHFSEIAEANYKLVRTKDGNTARVPAEPTDPNLGLITYMEKGKIKGVYVAKEIAETFNRNPYEAGIIYRVWQSLVNPFKQIFVVKNPFWATWNVQRDLRRSATLLPGASLTKMLKYALKSIPDVYRDIYKNISTGDVREMYETAALPVGRVYRGKAAVDATSEFDLMMRQYQLDPMKYKNVVVKGFSKFFNALDHFGQFSERVTKVASYKYLKENFPEMSAKRRAYLVRTRGGSPDFWRRGSGFMWYNNIFLFSNAGKEGWRGSIESFHENLQDFKAAKGIGAKANVLRTGMIWKMVKYDVIPKLMMAFAAYGGVKALGKRLGIDELEREGEWYEKAFEYIPDHDKTNYMCIPLGFTKNDKVVYAVMPHDFTGQVIAGIIWKWLAKGKPGYTRGLLDFAAGGLPYESLAPPISIGMDIFQYLRGHNPYDSWTGRRTVNELDWKAGGWIRLFSFAKQEWNKYGGSYFYRFPYDDLDKVQGELEKMFNKPGLSGFFKRFVRVSNRGKYEALLRNVEQDETVSKRARVLLEINSRIIEHLNESKVTSKEDARELWKNLKLSGLDVGRFSNFYDKYVKYAARKKGDIVLQALLAVRSNAERAKILEKVYGREFGDKDVTKKIRELKREVLEK